MIDGFNLGLEKGTGVATYARNLSYSLGDLGYDVRVLYGKTFSDKMPRLMQEVSFFDPPPENERLVRILLRRLAAALGASWTKAFQVPMTGAVITDTFKARLPHFDSLWNAPNVFDKANTQFSLLGRKSRVAMRDKPDICHWTYPLPLRVPGTPNIYTLHDLVPLRLPYTTLDKKNRYLQLMKWIAKTAAHIVTVSEHSRRDIVEILGVDPAKVTNTYQAVTIPAKLREKPEDLIQREIESTFGLKYKGYFLFFGSIEPKKNIGRMMEGYLASGAESPLVVIGAQAWKSAEELRMIQAEKVRAQIRGQGKVPVPNIIQLDYAPFSLLVTLIRGARAVLFPSLYEGFGLPILESMLLGTPVLTSNTSSIPEVAGEAALMVNPYDTREIAEGIRALETRPELRADFAERGRKQAMLFSEAAYQARLSHVYDAVLSRAGKKTGVGAASQPVEA